MSDIVTILLFVTVMVVSSVRKSRKEANKRKREIEFPRPAAGSSRPVFKDRSYGETEVPVSAPELHDLPADVLPQHVRHRRKTDNTVDNPQQAAAVMATDNSSITKSMSMHSKPEPQKSAEPLSETDVNGFEFDLRRAVIEAEILTPKFEQY